MGSPELDVVINGYKIEHALYGRFIRVYPVGDVRPWRPTGAPPVVQAHTHWSAADWERFYEYEREKGRRSDEWDRKYPWLDLLEWDDRQRVKAIEQETGLKLL